MVRFDASAGTVRPRTTASSGAAASRSGASGANWARTVRPRGAPPASTRALTFSQLRALRASIGQPLSTAGAGVRGDAGVPPDPAQRGAVVGREADRGRQDGAVEPAPGLGAGQPGGLQHRLGGGLDGGERVPPEQPRLVPAEVALDVAPVPV